MITSLIIDDEIHNLRNLSSLLEEHCPIIRIVGQYNNPHEALIAIRDKQPQLIFLDIKMPGKSGFDLLLELEDISFEIIFVSAFNEFAIQAFEFCAIDYLLKPLDFTKLIKSVNKVAERITQKQSSKDVYYFIQALNSDMPGLQKLSVHKNGKVVLIAIENICSIEAHGDYCQIELHNGLHYSTSKKLGAFDDLFRSSNKFIRISKSVLVRIDSISSYSKGEPCFIELENGKIYEVARRKKTEILGILKIDLPLKNKANQTPGI